MGIVKQKLPGLYPSPIMRVVKEFAENGLSEYMTLGEHPYKNWALQVYGADDDGNLMPLTSWVVWLVACPVISTEIGSQMAVHQSGGATPQQNGDVVWSTNTPTSGFYLNVSGLALGAGATKLVAVVEGSN